MKISDLGEFGLIERIGRTAARDAKRVLVGIGDDAAALALAPASTLLATTDMLLEGVHFDLGTTDLSSLGWKSAAVNLSDIAAMGGTPRFCLTSLGLPASLTAEGVAELYRGLNACLKRYRTALAGGDTCRSRTGLVISITLLGEAAKGRAVTRSGARPGDLLFVTGTLGDSAAGLELLRARGKGQGARGREEEKKLIERHLRPMPRVSEGMLLAGVASAMIDVSDGLSSDLAHLCEQSGVGAEVLADRVPLSKELRSVRGFTRPAAEYALSGGEDYELLFTVPRAKLGRLRSLRIKATEIGSITRGRTVMLVEVGRKRPLPPSGYDHFRTVPRSTRPRR
jgi:thiamine-monophosphate kinase